MQREFEHDEERRRYRPDDDPRDRYGNEEDRWSQEYRRRYSDVDFTNRMHDDRPYDRPGYEPEFGQRGGWANRWSGRDRETDDRDRRATGQGFGEGRGGRGYDAQRSQQLGRRFDEPIGQRPSFERPTFDRTDDSWQGGYYGQGRRWSGAPMEQHPADRTRDHDFGYGEPRRTYQSSYGDRGYGDNIGGYDAGGTGSAYSGYSGMGTFGAGDDGNRWSRQSGFDRQQYRGRHTGLGPRGYRRSDERIREDVCELLTWHGDVDASEMEVDVHDGVVVLRGTADSGRVRRMVEEEVESLPGVRDVQNELRVNQRTGYGSTSGPSPRFPGVSSEAREKIPVYGASAAVQGGTRWQIGETMDVIGSDGESLGQVKEVRGSDFLLDRPMARDVYVPFSAVQTVDGERVMLRYRSDDLGDQDWPSPDLMGTSEAPPAR